MGVSSLNEATAVSPVTFYCYDTITYNYYNISLICVTFILRTCTNNKLVTKYGGPLFIEVLLGKSTDGTIAYIHVKVVAPTCQWTHSPVICMSPALSLLLVQTPLYQ